MDACHAPFTPKHRYWMGLLLFALIVLNIVAAMATDTFLPVLSAGCISVELIVVKHFWSIRVYKSWLKGCLNYLFLSNLAIFTYGILFVGSKAHRQQILAYISLATALALFVTIVCFHFHLFLLAKTNTWPMTLNTLKDAIAGLRLRQAYNGQKMYQLMKDDQMDYNNKQLGIPN